MREPTFTNFSDADLSIMANALRSHANKIVKAREGATRAYEIERSRSIALAAERELNARRSAPLSREIYSYEGYGSRY